MAEPAAIHADLELFLTTWYRAALAARPEPETDDFEVDRVEWDPLPRKLLVIRDDGGPDDWFLTGERTVAFSILAGTKAAPGDAKSVAAIVHALRTLIPSTDPGNPISAVLGATSPVMVDEAQDRARVYFNVTFAVVGTAL